jgi:hypothetical protein
MRRDRMSNEKATAIVNRLPPSDLTRLELEEVDHTPPAFTSQNAAALKVDRALPLIT